MAVTLEWVGDHRFRATTPSGVEVVVDGGKEAGISPMESLLVALAACMGIDVVDILTKGRQEVTGCTVTAEGERRAEPPRRYTSIALTVELAGRDLSRARAERALQLSRETYCSVWHSMAPDVELSFDLTLRGA